MVQVPNDPSLTADNSQAASSTQTSVQVFGMPNGVGETHFDTGPRDDDPTDDEPSDAPQGTPVHNTGEDEPLFNCHFYRLRHPPLHIFMRNAAGVPMLR